MTDFEKLGLFYLGRRHDLAAGRTLDEPVLYDSRDLVTHAVCVGMTGSGKTGLCVGVIEEAALDGVPVLAIDPKGDLGNLRLTFPRLEPGDFLPWVDPDEARRADMTLEAFAASQAEAWARGLAEWGQAGARIERLRSAAEFTIFTPGSRAGRPVSILGSLAAPPGMGDDREVLNERASGTASSLLVLAGVDAGPRSREHTLLSMLLSAAWERGESLDLASLIRYVQGPPFDRVGVVDLESFFPSTERFDLAMALNGVMAAPGFDAWLDGEPLDPQGLLYSSTGRPRVSIFSIAHLGDAERMFFVSLLLNAVVAWVRGQTGTSSLRALLYMDEIAGYFPPVATPPSKAPLLTLLKQARAHGLGVVLATQNPVDLDYKGLGNAGTWFLGRLQTERDKARVLDGLEGASGGLDRVDADRLLSSLRKRVFLMHNVHEDRPVVFETRWTLSYLRGPLSRDQIRTLESTPQTQPVSSVGAPPPAASAGPSPAAAGAVPARPVLPPGIQELFIPLPARAAGGGDIAYRPVVLGAARVHVHDRRLGVDVHDAVIYAADLDDAGLDVAWSGAARLEVALEDLRREPDAGSPRFETLPAIAARPKKYAAWEKTFARWLSQHAGVELLRHPTLNSVSRPGESERDYRIRLQTEARSARDAAVDAVRRKYAARQAALAARLRRADQAVDREQQQASGQRMQTAVSFGATVLGALFGRRVTTAGTLGRATTAARGVGRTRKEAADSRRAAETVESIKEAIAELESQVAADAEAVAARYDVEAPLDRVVIRPRRGDVAVQFVALGWVPDV